jgi:ATP-binding cassette subfamily F protein 3
VKVCYFSQDQLDELTAGETALDQARALAPQLGEAAHRSIVAQMGRRREDRDAGGEALWRREGAPPARPHAYSKPHVLILNEPTSHLDIDRREALIVR